MKHYELEKAGYTLAVIYTVLVMRVACDTEWFTALIFPLSFTEAYKRDLGTAFAF